MANKEMKKNMNKTIKKFKSLIPMFLGLKNSYTEIIINIGIKIKSG